jgi:hypothetical protein
MLKSICLVGMEGCESGQIGSPGKRRGAKVPRGFESLSLRQIDQESVYCPLNINSLEYTCGYSRHNYFRNFCCFSVGLAQLQPALDIGGRLCYHVFTNAIPNPKKLLCLFSHRSGGCFNSGASICYHLPRRSKLLRSVILKNKC